LLVDRRTGAPRTYVIPWFDQRATGEVAELLELEDVRRLFRRSGLHPSYKFAVPKLLWLRKHETDVLKGSVWLSVADYVVYRLCGRMATDPSLAARTYALSLLDGRWDEEWIESLGFDSAVFPEVLAGGAAAGQITREGADETGLRAGIPVAVCGHDHVCSTIAASVMEPGPVLDSVGTAESMIGLMDDLSLDDGCFDSGLAFVPHVMPGRFCWLGGVSSAGASIEWARGILGEPQLSYSQIVELAAGASQAPTGIFYLPYLSGRGAPNPDSSVRGSLVGLTVAAGAPELMKSVLEGTAYAAESIRRTAETLTGRGIENVTVVGGGTKNRQWMQIRADISGCTLRVPKVGEAAALGAALLAALGCGLVETPQHLTSITQQLQKSAAIYRPSAENHQIYYKLYERVFMKLDAALEETGVPLSALAAERSP
jgi:sugar (pentulose or hexulose) kinase